MRPLRLDNRAMDGAPASHAMRWSGKSYQTYRDARTLALLGAKAPECRVPADRNDPLRPPHRR